MFVLQLYSISCLNTMSIPFCATYCTLSDYERVTLFDSYKYRIYVIAVLVLIQLGWIIIERVIDGT